MTITLSSSRWSLKRGDLGWHEWPCPGCGGPRKVRRNRRSGGVFSRCILCGLHVVESAVDAARKAARR